MILKDDRVKCDCCGRFRKSNEIVCMGGENDETWHECKECMSQSDFERYFPHEAKLHRENTGD